MLLATLLVSLASTTAASDPCDIRAIVALPSTELDARASKLSGEARACMEVAVAHALARENKREDAAKRFELAAETLTDVADALKSRAATTRQVKVSALVGKPPKTPAEAAERTMALVRSAKPREAVTVALSIPHAHEPGTIHDELEVATVTALVRAKRIDDALAHIAPLQMSDAIQKVRAWTFSKAQRFHEARDAYAQLSSTTTDAALKADTAFYAAFSAYEAGDLDDAKARFTASLPVMKDTSFDAQARWYIAFVDLLRGRWADAVPTLEEVVNLFPGDREVLKHRYWLGRALQENGDKRWKQVLQKLADDDPTHWYGLLARQRLERKPIKGVKVADDAVIKRARHDARAMRLWRLALDDEARGAVRGLGDDITVVGLAQKLDDTHWGWRRGAKFLPFPRVRGGKLSSASGWRVSYATPWRSVVEESAKKAGVPSSFVYAIMRTESGFDPRAISVAGARGVIQLLPSAARGAAQLAGRPVSDAEKIFEPDVAIDLGAALLGVHEKEFGSLMLAAAAYNGAPENVALWLKHHGHLDLEMFVERVPFRETRDYIKRVLAVEATYRALDGGTLELELPEKLPAPPEKFTTFPMDE